MSKPAKDRKAKPLTYEQAVSELPAAEKALRAESAEYSQAYESCIHELHRLHGIMAHERAKSLAAQLRVDKLRAVIDKGDGQGKPAITYRLVEDPYVTQGLIDAVANGEVKTRHERNRMAPINQTLLVGGLARVSKKTEAQMLAAARYMHLYERSQIGGARATDYTQVRVDTSGPRQDQISAAQDDARQELSDARKALGIRGCVVVDRVVIHGESVRTLARKLGHGDSGRARRCAEKELLDVLDVLVDQFKLLPAGSRRASRWNDGSRAEIARDHDKNDVGNEKTGHLAPLAQGAKSG